MMDRPHNEILGKIEKEKIDFVELWFVDIFGELHSLGIPSYSVTEDHIRNGFDKLDSSSIRGFSSISESDVTMVPDTGTFKILPPDYDRENRRNARMFVNIFCRNRDSGDSMLSYDRDSRAICAKASEEMKKFGLWKALWGPEIEFFVFDTQDKLSSFDFSSGHGFSDDAFETQLVRSNEIGIPGQVKSGYYQAQPIDSLAELRKDICDDLHKYFGIRVEAQHHEVATRGQCEINIEYGETLEIADNVTTIKNLAKVKAQKKNKRATFMPKPIYGDNASAMHVHLSLWTRDGLNAMHDSDQGAAGISQLARYYIGGILDHAGALCAITNPTTNSYKRLVPGFEAPVYACWGIGNRSTAIRIPVSDKKNERKKRIEYRVPDSAANSYLLESALIMAGLDGIRRKTDPGDSVQDNVYHLTPEHRRSLKIKPLPTSLKESLDLLESDCKFLEGVFTRDFLEAYISLKNKEYKEFAQMPTSWEISTYSKI